jgi:processive 1,2-diacylglycerol beta-glucosyltransferase
VLKVLLCYLVKNSGHHAAALAIEAALRQIHPSVETLCVDLLEYTHPRWSAILQKTYMVTIRRTPEVWEALYDSPWLDYLTRKIRTLIQRGNGRQLLSLMEDFDPDIAVCTQAHPLAVLSAYVDRHNKNLPLWGVVTDFIPHRFWVVKGRTHYVAPDEAAADRLVWLGVERRHVHVLGIPIKPNFAGRLKEKALRENGRRVLIMGGSRGLGAKYRTIRSLDKSPEEFMIDVVTGMNRRLRARLVRGRGTFKHPIRIRGYVKDVAALMRKASLLVSKPGGVTSAEAMAAGVPMLLIRPLPGQERGNTNVLVRHGAAVHIRHDREVEPVVTALMKNAELLGMMRERAAALGRPTAATRIAEAVLAGLESKRTLA